LNEVIQLSGDSQNLPAVKTVLNELGYAHKRRGIPKDAFNDFRASLISYLKANVSWGDNVEAAWNDALDNCLAIVFSSIDGNPVH
jgi:hemoglobin-like flavoprotein